MSTITVLKINYDARYVIIAAIMGVIPFIALALVDPNSGFPTTKIVILYTAIAAAYLAASTIRNQETVPFQPHKLGSLLTVIAFLFYIGIKINNFVNHSEADIRSTFNYDAYHYWYGMILPIPLIYKYNEFVVSNSYSGVTRLIVVIAVICLSLLTGTRAFAIFFILAYFSVPRKVDYSIGVLIGVVLLLIAIVSLLRGVSVESLTSHVRHVLFGGQYLYINNVDRIHQSVVPGWQTLLTVTFPGFFVLLATLIDAYLNTGLSYFHYESVFWWTHKFQYVRQLEVPMNSYFTPLLHADAVGYWKYVSILSISSFLVGLSRSQNLRCLGISILGYYLVCGFMYSIFNNPVFCFLLAVVVLNSMFHLCSKGIMPVVEALKKGNSDRF